MLLADSSVWIDYFAGIRSAQTDRLSDALDREDVLVGDLMIAEVLQGVSHDRDFENIRRELNRFLTIAICDESIAITAARNYRALRKRGITIRKTIDTLIATRCIIDGIPLLYTDRDFDPFVAHLGLKSALPLTAS